MEDTYMQIPRKVVYEETKDELYIYANIVSQGRILGEDYEDNQYYSYLLDFARYNRMFDGQSIRAKNSREKEFREYVLKEFKYKYPTKDIYRYDVIDVRRPLLNDYNNSKKRKYIKIYTNEYDSIIKAKIDIRKKKNLLKALCVIRFKIHGRTIENTDESSRKENPRYFKDTIDNLASEIGVSRTTFYKIVDKLATMKIITYKKCGRSYIVKDTTLKDGKGGIKNQYYYFTDFYDKEGKELMYAQKKEDGYFLALSKKE